MRHRSLAEQGPVMTRLRRRGRYGFDGDMTGLLGMIAVAVAVLAAVALALAGLVAPLASRCS